MFKNEIINRGEDYFVSYLPPSNDALGNRVGETALVYEDKYYILNGDWREQYKNIKTFEEGYKIFEKNIDKIGFWSNTPR